MTAEWLKLRLAAAAAGGDGSAVPGGRQGAKPVKATPPPPTPAPSKPTRRRAPCTGLDSQINKLVPDFSSPATAKKKWDGVERRVTHDRRAQPEKSQPVQDIRPAQVPPRPAQTDSPAQSPAHVTHDVTHSVPHVKDFGLGLSLGRTMTHAERNAKYRAEHAEEVRIANRERMRAARASASAARSAKPGAA